MVGTARRRRSAKGEAHSQEALALAQPVERQPCLWELAEMGLAKEGAELPAQGTLTPFRVQRVVSGNSRRTGAPEAMYQRLNEPDWKATERPSFLNEARV